jgi:hypothetical protein
VTIQIVIDVQCQEKSRRIPCIRRPIQQVCLALLEHGGLKPYEIQQSLERLASFWVSIANRSRKLEDYAEIFEEG